MRNWKMKKCVREREIAVSESEMVALTSAYVTKGKFCTVTGFHFRIAFFFSLLYYQPTKH
jgi:hypothetical protein